MLNDTSSEGLFNVLVESIKSYGLLIDDIRGQGYENGSNMKGKHKGVQSRLLKINPRALYMPCACHSLNLTLCDMAKSCDKVVSIFLELCNGSMFYFLGLPKDGKLCLTTWKV